MAEIAYRSEVRIQRVKGPIRRAYLPGEKEPVVFGVHGAIAEHYKVSPQAYEPRASTIDYVIAATAGWLAGTFGGALEARQIPATGDNFSATAVGEVEKTEDGVLVIRRIRVRFHVKSKASDQGTVERVHGFFADKCPLYRTLKGAIEIRTELNFEPVG